MTVLANNATPSAHRVCPSLYAATRLARLVLRVKERLKARMMSRRLPAEPSIICRHDDFNARVFKDAKYAIKTRSKNTFWNLPDCKSKQVRAEIPTLLRELHAHSLPGGASVMMTAEDDELFLKQDAQKIAKANNRDGLRHMFDVTTLLLDRLQPFPDGYRPTQGRRHEDGKTSWTGSICPKTVANLEHLLRCLQQASYVALIGDMLRAIEADLACWHQYWQQSRAIFQGWFSEWPNGQRPLNTTWPWNVKPSLLVLWGVCWMFYDIDPAGTRKPPRLQPQQHPTGIRTQQQPVATPPELENWNSRTDVSPYPFWSPEGVFHAQVPVLPNFTGFADVSDTHQETQIPVFGAGTAGIENYLPSNEIAWPSNLNTLSNTLSPNPTSGNWGFPINNPNPLNPEIVSQTVEARGGPEPYGQQKWPGNNDKEKCQTVMGLLVPSFNMRAYPSPRSVVSGSGVSTYQSDQRETPGMPSSSMEKSPSPDREKSEDIADLENNDKAVYRCLHKDCASEPREFLRKCEYTKHKDKHDRPYICREAGCEKIRGFTYAGGLLRHQREVHRQHGGPKSCLKCPHPNCKRSSGAGFSRKENLTEHLRRVHRKVGDEPDSITLLATGDGFSTSAFRRDVENPRKRRRGDDSEADSDGLGEEMDLQNQIKVMRKDLENANERLKNADERLQKLETQVAKLSAGLRAAAT